MKYLLLFVFILLGDQHVKAQNNRSILYNEKGQLFADTTLSISKEQYNCWTYAEDNLVAHFSTIEFPQIYLDNNIRQKDVIIVSFICDSTTISEIKVLNDSSAYSISIVDGLKKISKSISYELKNASPRYLNSNYTGKYYFAISFEIINFKEMLAKLKAVPIIKSSVPLISHGIY